MVGQMDELLYLVGGVVTAKVTRELAKKYADPKANYHIASLKGFGKPSIYTHIVLGAAGAGYAVYQADKKRGGRLNEEEYFALGFGLTALADAVVDGVMASSPPATVSFVQPSNVRVIGGMTVQPGGYATGSQGYPKAPNGTMRGVS